VLRISHTSVTGPIPLGTGVTARAIPATSSERDVADEPDAPVVPGHRVDADVEQDRARRHVLRPDQPGRTAAR
jgi:hypothetical protein